MLLVSNLRFALVSLRVCLHRPHEGVILFLTAVAGNIQVSWELLRGT